MSESARDQLLAATISQISETGLAWFSLRSVAAKIGTSHRMFSHRFGSKAGLEAAIVQRVTELMTMPLLDADTDHPNLSVRQQVLFV